MTIHVFKLFKQQLKKKRKKFPKNKKFRFKLCCDGREINGQSQIGLALVPLDMQDIFGTQEVLSVFYFALIEGAETKETIQSYLTKYYKKEIQQIQEKGVKIDGVDISLDLFYCSDLKNVRQTMDDNCFCCKFNKGVFKLGDSRVKCCAFGIKYFKHIICLLHMKQRIHERIMAIIGNSLIDQDFQTFTNNIRNLPQCGDFYWKLKSDIPKEEQLDKDDDDNDEVQKLSTRQIKGYQIDIMLNHIGDMFLGVNSPHEDYKNLLQVWKYYLCLLQATNDEIGCSGSEKKKNHVADLNVYGLLLRKALQAVSTKDVVKAKYIHYTLHIPAMVEEFGSLCVYSNQGFENSHKYHKTLCNRITNNGGSKHPIPLIVAIMNWQCRKMLSCIETDSDWGKIVLRNRLTSKKPLDTLLNRTYIP